MYEKVLSAGDVKPKSKIVLDIVYPTQIEFLNAFFEKYKEFMFVYIMVLSIVVNELSLVFGYSNPISRYVLTCPVSPFVISYDWFKRKTTRQFGKGVNNS